MHNQPYLIELTNKNFTGQFYFGNNPKRTIDYPYFVHTVFRYCIICGDERDEKSCSNLVSVCQKEDCQKNKETVLYFLAISCFFKAKPSDNHHYCVHPYAQAILQDMIFELP